MTTNREIERFGPYALLHFAGVGGMGQVRIALAGRPGWTKLCALKTISHDMRYPEREARFRREARIALSLSHSAIAQTFSVDEIEGELCILQEYVQGVNLRRLVRRCSPVEPIPMAVALYIGREVARALSYAHTLPDGGIIHRDVTPDNVMLSYSGEVKLIDFGIAKASEGEGPLTELGMIVGRPTYTAPEVFTGAAESERTDIFSLGMVLWYALTGTSPEDFKRDEAAPSAGPPSLPAPSTIVPEIPPAVDEVVARLLAADPARRYETADEVQEALARLLPAGIVGDRDLTRFLARHFEVDQDRSFLTKEVERARRTIADAAPASLSAPSSVRRSRRWPIVVVVAGALAGTGGVLAWEHVLGRRFDVPSSSSVSRNAAEPPALQAAKVRQVVATAPTATVTPAPDADPIVKHSGAVAARRPKASPVFPQPGSLRAKDPGVDPGDMVRRAEQSFRDGDLAGALATARSAVRAGGGAQAHTIAGKVLLAEHKLADAEVEISEAIESASPAEQDILVRLRQSIRTQRRRDGE